ncbi:carbohydrate ABC transporter permease, partial [Candidatus Aerophobetes bacterium]|nr:carbohydrate ABC transporter permease [Candidatus Aerophobetes bacterium]
MRATRSKKLVFILGLVFILMFVLVPMYWTVITSFKPASETEGGKLGELTIHSFTLDNYKKILLRNPLWEAYVGKNILTSLKNSFFIAVCATAIALIVGPLAGYALAMLSIKGKNLISGYVLFAYIFPPFILMIPLVISLTKMGLVNHLAGVIFSHLIISVPFATWMLRGYFLGIPRDLYDAGLIDGCSKLGVLTRIVLPVSAPGLVTAAIFAFTQSWSELLFALVIINRKELYTLPIVATMLKIGDVYVWGQLMATAVIAAIPP